MEDRYLFKAKIKENNNTGYEELDWIIGNLVVEQSTGRHFIIDLSHFDENTKLCDVMVEVDPSTICQCTGLKDKNGKLIWENDIVSFEDTGEEGYEYKEGFDFVNKAKVEFAEGRWSLTDFVSDNSGVMDEMYDHAEFMEFWQYCEVIGNKFDNPELLEV